MTDLRTPAHEDLPAHDDLAADDLAAPHGDGGAPDDASLLPTEGRSGTDWSFYRWLALIAAASLLWRIVFIAIWRWDLPIWGDAFFYHESGKLVADGEGFVNPLLRDEQAADHPPLYIVFLALLSMLGIRSGNSHIVATAVVGTASIVFAGLAGREIAGRRTGLIAAGLFTVYAAIWSWDGMLLSETFAILFVTALIWAVYRFRRVPSWWGAVGLGVLLALATFSRAELLLLSLLVVTPVILLVRSRSWRTRIGWLVTAGAACLAVLSPWLAYNMSRFEGTVLLSNGAEITLASASCDRTYYGEYTGYWAMECAIQFLEENGFEGADGEQSERSEVLLREAVDYISANRERVPYVVLARWGRITGLWNPIQQSDLDRFPEGRDGWVTKLALVQWYPLVLLAGGGAIALRRRKVPIYPLLGPVVTVLVAITIMFATNRYRASAEGAIALLAAVGIDAVFRWYRRLRDDPEDRPVPPDDPPPPDDDVDAPADGADAPAAASAASPGTATGRS